MNGDGIDDLIIGARNANDEAGESYVIFGREDWSSFTPEEDGLQISTASTADDLFL